MCVKLMNNFLLSLIVICCLVFTACGCEHTLSDATCTTEKTYSEASDSLDDGVRDDIAEVQTNTNCLTENEGGRSF